MQSNNSPASRLIIFDMDGTLFNTETAFLPAIEEFVRRYNLPVPDRDFSLAFCGEPIHVFINWLGSLEIDKPLKELIAEFDHLELEMTGSRGELYPNVTAVLGYLRENGYQLAVCSNGTERYINRVITRFNLGEYFLRVAIPQYKGHTKSIMVSELLEQFKPDFAVMIGDRQHDFLSAKENSILSIGALYGYGGAELEQADYRVKEPLVIPALIKQLEKQK